MSIFTLTIHARKPGSHDHGFQERQVVAQLLQQVAQAIGSGSASEGNLTFDRSEVGSWSFGEGSHVRRELVKQNGPGTMAARIADPDEKERIDNESARQAHASATLRPR